jgi:hypothetical protein
MQWHFSFFCSKPHQHNDDTALTGQPVKEKCKPKIPIKAQKSRFTAEPYSINLITLS